MLKPITGMRIPLAVRVTLPLVTLMVLAGSPFIWHRLYANEGAHLEKIIFYTAFSGQLHSRGHDTYRAVQLAVALADRAAPHGTVVAVSAVDDQGQPQIGRVVAAIAANDPKVHAVLCCSTGAVASAVHTRLRSDQQFISTQVPSASAETTASLLSHAVSPSSIVIASDTSHQQPVRASSLARSFRINNWHVIGLSFDFARGDSAASVAQSIARIKPGLIYINSDYPDAATLSLALRSAGATAPIVGDSRLDGATPAALLAAVSDWYYVAPDRTQLARMVSSSFTLAFKTASGHAPSEWDIFSYLDALDATKVGSQVPSLAHLSFAIYKGATVYNAARQAITSLAAVQP
ncbi:MAG: ABC transporter substrate-binding protein [Chloroflexi bacterium]|nr:ABC transporter substrate-binding protein [Chloroflexota bacterium]